MPLTTLSAAQTEAVYRSFPAERLAPYALECDSNLIEALHLYSWNTCVSSALYETLSHFEVILRNRMDEALQSRHQYRKRPGDWLDDAFGEFSIQASGAIADAKLRASGGRKDAKTTRGRIIAELNFGFWRRLLDRRYERVHGSAIMRLYPNHKRRTNDDMENLRQLIDPLYALRNRIAHLEPVWQLNLRSRRDDAIQLIESVSAETAKWVAGTCRLDSILLHRIKSK